MKTMSIAEAAAAYGTAVADLRQPLILQQEGYPFNENHREDCPGKGKVLYAAGI
jgi:hypothetical protein